MSSSDDKAKLSIILATFWEEISAKVDAYAIPAIQTRIEEWVGKDPELTEALCKYAVQYAPRMTEDRAKSTIDEVVRKEILRDWESSLAGPHLRNVQSTLLSHERRDSLLIEYIKVLQRGQIAKDNSSEQFTLLASRLLKEKGGRLSVSNKLYAEVFNLKWVEQQIPGITKPVTVVSPQTAKNMPSASTKLYSKLAIAACGLAVVGAAISSYIRESGGEAQAKPENLEIETAVVEDAAVREETAVVENATNSSVGEAQTETDAAPISASVADSAKDTASATEAPANETANQTDSAETSARASDRKRFDTGEEHAKNSRWVLMMREFCAISTDSVYFTSAQNDLALWKELYPEDLKIAVEVVAAEQGGQCVIADTLSLE